MVDKAKRVRVVLNSPPLSQAADGEQVATAASDDLAAQVTRYHLVLFQGRGSINRALVRDIQGELNERITTPPDQTEIDVWLESPGGDANAAYKLMLELRSRCRQLQAVVPDYAKSAATLMALGMDTIYMSAAAELGPLDVQIEHPDREGYIVSGLDVANSLEFLTRTAVSSVVTGGGTLIEYTGLSRQFVLHESFLFMAQLFQPLIAKLDPQLLHQSTQQLDVAERYAVTLMRARTTNRPDQDDDYIKGIAHHLVRHYPDHPFVISRDEARALGLPIVNAERYFRWEHVMEFHDIFRDNPPPGVRVIPDAVLAQEDEPPLETQEDSNEPRTGPNE